MSTPRHRRVFACAVDLFHRVDPYDTTPAAIRMSE